MELSYPTRKYNSHTAYYEDINIKMKMEQLQPRTKSRNIIFKEAFKEKDVEPKITNEAPPPKLPSPNPSPSAYKSLSGMTEFLEQASKKRRTVAKSGFIDPMSDLERPNFDRTRASSSRGAHVIRSSAIETTFYGLEGAINIADSSDLKNFNWNPWPNSDNPLSNPQSCSGLNSANVLASGDMELEPLLAPVPELNIEMDDLVNINVGGRKFLVMRKTLTRLEDTRLGRLAMAKFDDVIVRLCDGYFPGTIPEFFFNRNWSSFETILSYYREGSLHLNNDVCAMVFKTDLDYWGVDEIFMEPCCALKYYPDIELCVKELQCEEKVQRKIRKQKEAENFGEMPSQKVRKFLWNMMEYPESSKIAQFFTLFSLFLVFISTVTFVLSTMKEFEIEDEDDPDYVPPYPTVNRAIAIIDNFAIAFFCMEYFTRLICSPFKISFLFSPMNLIDLAAILPVFLSLLLAGLEDLQIVGKAGKVVRLIRVMRIMRIFKLVRHFSGLQSLIYTLHQAYKELGLLMMLVAVAVLTFSCLVFYVEKETVMPNGKTWTLYDSFWWGLMTITTVGMDGNNGPKTFMGKCLGGVCALSGVFILTLPIPIVVNSFAGYYKNRLWRNEVANKKATKTKQLKDMEQFAMLKVFGASVTASTLASTVGVDVTEDVSMIGNT